MNAIEAKDVLQAYRDSAIVERDHVSMTSSRQEYWQDRINALDAAIAALDETRWRDVRDELPSKDGLYVVVVDGWADLAWWQGKEWSDINFVPELWRGPITLPDEE